MARKSDWQSSPEMLCNIITAIVTSDLRLRSLFSIVLYFTQILLPRVPADLLELKETESEAKEKPDKDIDNLY